MELLQGDGHPDAGKHGVNHYRCDGKGSARPPAQTEQDLQRARAEGYQTGHLPAEFVDDLGHHDGEARGGATDLQRGPANRPRDDTADDGGDQACHQGCARGNSDTQRERQRDEEHHERGGKVVSHVPPEDCERFVERRARFSTALGGPTGKSGAFLL